MKRPEHLGVVARKRMTSGRASTIAFVAAIHVAAIYALASALVPQLLPKVPDPFVLIKQKPDVMPKHPLPPLVLQHPAGPFAKPPVVQVTDDKHAITAPRPHTGGNDNGPTIQPLRGIVSTHTTPPYPLSSLRLGQEGTVRLMLTVASDGSVISATVEHSSGSYALDQAAVDWVRKHWRYQPRTVNGQAETSATEADIRFDLRNAR